MDRALHRDFDNIWRHFWAGCMREVGATTRLPLEPIAPDLEELLETVVEVQELTAEAERLKVIAALPPRQRFEATILEWRRGQARVQDQLPRRRRQIKQLAREVGDVANDLLDRLILRPEEPDRSMDRTHLAGRRHLQDCDYYLIAELNERLQGGGRYGPEDDLANGYIYIDPEAADHHELVEMFWPVDCAIACEKADDWIFVLRMASVTPRRSAVW